MATKPTRRQLQARDHLAEALFLIRKAVQADESSHLEHHDFEAIADRLGRICPAFDRDAIVARAIEHRVQVMGLRSDAVELLTLIEDELTTLQVLELDDDALRAIVARLEEELGEVT